MSDFAPASAEGLRFGAFPAPYHSLDASPTLAIQRDLELMEHLEQIAAPPDSWACVRLMERGILTHAAARRACHVVALVVRRLLIGSEQR